MKFGIREVCNCRFEHLDGNRNFIIDTARMSTLESASTTVYAQGGRGFARLAAWEGEKTVTFTVEDAILTNDSLVALLGADFDNSGKIRVKSTSFAGYYKITADTLVRNIDDGADEPAKITIHKAKLQSNINLSMAPNGDPSTFTFTFDAFATTVDGEPGVIYDFAIGAVGEGTAATLDTKVTIHDGTDTYIATTSAETPAITIASDTNGSITITDATWTKDGKTATLNLNAKTLLNTYSFKQYKKSTTAATTIALDKGSHSKWYII